jgi:hypothetical protein
VGRSNGFAGAGSMHGSILCDRSGQPTLPSDIIHGDADRPSLEPSGLLLRCRGRN